jgi:small subunit ribosomal protein S6
VQSYECVFILRADRPESEMQARVDRIAGILADHEGEITQQDRWGVRRLAYEIDDETKGDYMLLRFRSRGTSVAELDRALRLDDQVLRHLIVVDEKWEERNRAAMAKRRQAKPSAESRDR